jgi:hypothetical protein
MMEGPEHLANHPNIFIRGFPPTMAPETFSALVGVGCTAVWSASTRQITVRILRVFLSSRSCSQSLLPHVLASMYVLQRSVFGCWLMMHCAVLCPRTC